MEAKASVSRESTDSIGLIYCTTISTSGALYHRSYHCSVPYQLQLWALTTSVICNAKTALSVAACSKSVGSPFCLTLSLWMKSPRSTRLHPRGTSVIMVTMPITVTEREAVSRGRAGGAIDTDGCFRAQHSTACSPPFFSGNSLHPRPVPLQTEICLHKELAGLRLL